MLVNVMTIIPSWTCIVDTKPQLSLSVRWFNEKYLLSARIMFNVKS